MRVNVVAMVVLLPSLFSSTASHQQAAADESVDVYGGHWKGRELLEDYEESIIDMDDVKFVVGYALGWISAVIAIFALPPQIIRTSLSHMDMYFMDV